LLEDVYEQAKQSEGSAQEELNKYLDSVAGKLQLITNKIQELATLTFDSEGLKVILDIVNLILSGVLKLSDAFGALNVAVGAFGGYALNKKGLGFINYNSKKNEWSSMLQTSFWQDKPKIDVGWAEQISSAYNDEKLNTTYIKDLLDNKDAFDKLDSGL